MQIINQYSSQAASFGKINSEGSNFISGGFKTNNNYISQNYKSGGSGKSSSNYYEF